MRRIPFNPSYWGYGLAVLPLSLILTLDAFHLLSHRWGENIPGILFLGVTGVSFGLLIFGFVKRRSRPRLRWKIAFALLMLPLLALDILVSGLEIWHVCPEAIYAPGSAKANAVEAYRRYWKQREPSYEEQDPIVAEAETRGWRVHSEPAYCNLFGDRTLVRLDGGSLLIDKESLKVLEERRWPP